MRMFLVGSRSQMLDPGVRLLLQYNLIVKLLTTVLP